LKIVIIIVVIDNFLLMDSKKMIFFIVSVIFYYNIAYAKPIFINVSDYLMLNQVYTCSIN
jgi:hypothetical protein